MVNSSLNNFLNETFHLTDFFRSFLELPRELPGFLVIFISAALFFLPSRKLGKASLWIGAAGLVLLALFPVNIWVMFLWLFVYSAGQHVFMPLHSSIGMELSREGESGKRLGQLFAVKNIATIAGSAIVFVGFQYLHFNFTLTFLIAAVFYIVAGALMNAMHPGKTQSAQVRLKLYPEYGFYYWLSILFGTRKQIFLTFAPWVMVRVFGASTAYVASLFTIGAVIGVGFQLVLGPAIDRLGEKAILTFEAAVLIFVCLGYGFSRELFEGRTALIAASVCFITDQLLMSVNIARSTYMKRIAKSPDHIAPTLAMSVTIDHFFSIGVALCGGIVWKIWGYQMVFLAGAVIALLNLVSALSMRRPVMQKTEMESES